MIPMRSSVRTGGESAQSIIDLVLRDRPGIPAGCSRSERSLDTWCWCVASSRVVRPTSCRRHLGHAFRHAMAALLIRLAKSFVLAMALCAASTSKMRRNRLPCLLIAPSRCRPPELRSRGITPDSWPPVCLAESVRHRRWSPRTPGRDRTTRLRLNSCAICLSELLLPPLVH